MRKKLLTIDNLEAYLYTVTKNRALYYLKQAKYSSEISLDQLPIGIVNENDNPEEITLASELQDAIDVSIQDLPERCRLIFLMAREEGLKHREIAEILSISEKTVDAQILIAIKKMGIALKKYLGILF